MSEQGHLIFVDELAHFVARVADPRLAPIAALAASPLRVAVHGRPGVGARTVARALGATGLSVVQTSSLQTGSAEIDVRVIAEALKPEDRDAIAAAHRPVLVVFNKADLTGFGSGGPLALAQRRCDRLSALTGLPTVPLVALLAVAALEESAVDEAALDGLRLLVGQPADLRSPDDFVAGEHVLPTALRVGLVETLDLFGIAHAVVALRRDPAAGRQSAVVLRAVLRQVSGLDPVIAHLAAISSEVRYHRVVDAVAELESLAITSEEVLAQQIWSFLNCDDTVIARMAAAVDVIEAAGGRVDPGADPAAHLRRARDWRRYAGGPVDALHQSCGTDITRGSLRRLHAEVAAQSSRGRSR